jgi:superfamily II RNA helicase
VLDLDQLFPFVLDDFQHQAIAALDAGQSVVVCAPTGSGKTLIGEYAIYRALDAWQAGVLYHPPQGSVEPEAAGLSRAVRPRPGGVAHGGHRHQPRCPGGGDDHRDFRNMLYGTRIGEVGTSLQHVQAVVLDECHYMNDRQRGTVWEESIIYCPPEIQLLALSATVENSDQLTDWLVRSMAPRS